MVFYMPKKTSKTTKKTTKRKTNSSKKGGVGLYRNQMTYGINNRKPPSGFYHQMGSPTAGLGTPAKALYWWDKIEPYLFPI
jgi:hypothetical protein